MPFTNPIVAGTKLVRSAIQSPDYVAGVSGWSINRDGTAEFAELLARGELLVEGADGSEVHAYSDPTLGAVIDLQPEDKVGEITSPARLRVYRDLVAERPSLRLTGPSIDGSGNDPSTIDMGTGGIDGGTLIGTAGRITLLSPNQISLESGYGVGIRSNTLGGPGGDLDVEHDLTVGDSATVNGVPVLTGLKGVVSVTTNASGVGTQAVVFSTPFAASPIMSLTLVTTSGSGIKADYFVVALSASGFTARLDLNSATAITLTLHWVAFTP